MSNSATPWTVACQAPLSIRLSRQEYWSGYSPGDLPNPGVKPRSPDLQADSLQSEPPGNGGEKKGEKATSPNGGKKTFSFPKWS